MSTRAKEIRELGNTGYLDIDTNGNVKIGKYNSGTPTGTAVTNSVLSVYSDTNLGTTAGDELKLLSLSGHSGNQSALTFRHRRLTDGNNFFSDAFTLTQDVDNTEKTYSYMKFHDGVVVVDNKIGIGTDNPVSAVSVNSGLPTLTSQGESTITLEYDGGDNALDRGPGIDFRQKWYSLSDGLVKTGAIYGIKTGGSGIHGGGLAFYTKPHSGDDLQETMVLTGTDRIGIGTNNPERKLHIYGSGFNESSMTIQRTDTGSANDGALIFKTAAGANSNYALGGIWWNNTVDGNYNALIRARTDNSSGTSGQLEFVTGTAVSNVTAPSVVIKSSGLMTTKALNTDAITSYNITGSYTAGTEYTFTTRSDIYNLGYGWGRYKFMVYSDTFNAGTSHYSTHTSYEDFYFVQIGSNTNTVQTFAYSPSMGHAPNTATRAVDLRLRHTYGTDANYPSNQRFTFIPVNGFTGLDGNAGKHLRIYLYKVP